MEITISQEVKEDVLGYARKIAVYNKYPHLVNELQPVEDRKIDGKVYPGLETKLFREWVEFRQATDREHKRHEAADLYYYSAALSEQSGQSILPSTLASLHTFGFEVEEVECAARTKYGWRSLAPGNKHEAYELALIEATWAKQPIYYVLNSAVLTSYGSFNYQPFTPALATSFLKAHEVWSVIGYAETAQALSTITGVEIPTNRMSIAMRPGDEALVFRLTERLDPARKGEIGQDWILDHCELGLLSMI